MAFHRIKRNSLEKVQCDFYGVEVRPAFGPPIEMKAVHCRSDTAGAGEESASSALHHKSRFLVGRPGDLLE
jgi:hypothetical protein